MLLLRGLTGSYQRSIDASAVVAHYAIDRVGTVFSWRGGIQYAPIPDLRFRAQYARAKRAPDIAELYSPPRGNFEVADDECDGVTPTTDGRLAAHCRLEPDLRALLPRQASAGPAQEYEQSGSQKR